MLKSLTNDLTQIFNPVLSKCRLTDEQFIVLQLIEQVQESAGEMYNPIPNEGTRWQCTVSKLFHNLNYMITFNLLTYFIAM